MQRLPEQETTKPQQKSSSTTSNHTTLPIQASTVEQHNSQTKETSKKETQKISKTAARRTPQVMCSPAAERECPLADDKPRRRMLCPKLQRHWTHSVISSAPTAAPLKYCQNHHHHTLTFPETTNTTPITLMHGSSSTVATPQTDHPMRQNKQTMHYHIHNKQTLATKLLHSQTTHTPTTGGHIHWLRIH